jgi:hypothetical protein
MPRASLGIRRRGKAEQHELCLQLRERLQLLLK